MRKRCYLDLSRRPSLQRASQPEAATSAWLPLPSNEESSVSARSRSVSSFSGSGGSIWA
jgi:hypothetical protein